MKVLGELAKGIDFLRRDLRIELSYRLSFLNQFAGIFLSCCGFYFLARFVGPRAFADLGSDYFSFVLVGVAFFEYLTVSLTGFSTTLRDAQMTGTLEQLLVTQTGAGTLVWGGSLYHFVLTTFHAVVYLALGATVFGLSLAKANLMGALAVAALSVLAFSGLGILSAAMIVLFKKGNPLNWLIVSASWLMGGVLYPVSVLPAWVQPLARWNPVTASLDALRATLLKGASLATVSPQTALLAAWAAVLLPASMLLFRWAVEQSKVSGTLGDY
jgi:ABC-2 type transport system permease protein